MSALVYAAIAASAADGLHAYGPFRCCGDATVAAHWLAEQHEFARPVALQPPEVDPITVSAVADVSGDVIELPGPVLPLLAVHDHARIVAGETVVSLVVDPPARTLALFVGPFTATTSARSWIARTAAAGRSGDYRARLRIHRLWRTDTVPVLPSVPKPDTDSASIKEVTSR